MADADGAKRKAESDAPTSAKAPRTDAPLVPAIAAVDPDRYDELLQAKVSRVRALFAAPADDVDGAGGGGACALPEPLDVFESPRAHFRMRANFRVWHDRGASAGGGGRAERDDGRFYYVMFDRDDKETPLELTAFPMGSRLLNRLMPRVLAGCRDGPACLRRSLNEVRFVTTTTRDALVVLCYNCPIAPAEWNPAAAALATVLEAGAAEDDGDDGAPCRVGVIGRSRKVKLVAGAIGDTATEVLRVDGVAEPLTYRQTEGAFTQPNASVAAKMLAWSADVTRAPPARAPRDAADDAADDADDADGRDDLLELYCGNGNFTIALAKTGHFRGVLATEVSKSSVELAHANLRANGLRAASDTSSASDADDEPAAGADAADAAADAAVDAAADSTADHRPPPRVVIARLSSEEFSAAWRGRREFVRMPRETLARFDRLRTVLVDPPRAGLDRATRALVRGFARVVYISCNPETLRRDVATLSATHRLSRFAVFDQFPYTPHLECGAVLEEVTPGAAAAAAAAEASLTAPPLEKGAT